jgi:hypothetical protein
MTDKEIVIEQQPYTKFNKILSIRLNKEGKEARHWLISRIFGRKSALQNRKVALIDNIAFLTLKKLVEEGRIRIKAPDDNLIE